jgi:tetratricopeptide (TPR) repeat protein
MFGIGILSDLPGCCKLLNSALPARLIGQVLTALALSLIGSDCCLARRQLPEPEVLRGTGTALQLIAAANVASPGQNETSAVPAAGVLTQKEFADLAGQIDSGALITARSKIEDWLRRAPQDWQVALLAGRLYRKMGLSGLAILQYEKVRSRDPHMVEALVALSQLHLENLSTEIAIGLARQAVALDPGNKQARLALVEALLSGQSLHQADEQAKILAGLFPSDADVLHTLSGVAMAFGHYTDAVRLLNQALATKPRNVAWRLELADLYQAQGNYQACHNTLSLILEVEPYSLDALNKMAHVQEFYLHEYMPALHSYRAIKEIVGDSAAAQAGIDRCLTKQSDLALNARNAVYRLFGVSIRDPRVEGSVDLPPSF